MNNNRPPHDDQGEKRYSTPQRNRSHDEPKNRQGTGHPPPAPNRRGAPPRNGRGSPPRNGRGSTNGNGRSTPPPGNGRGTPPRSSNGTSPRNNNGTPPTRNGSNGPPRRPVPQKPSLWKRIISRIQRWTKTTKRLVTLGISLIVIVLLALLLLSQITSYIKDKEERDTEAAKVSESESEGYILPSISETTESTPDTNSETDPSYQEGDDDDDDDDYDGDGSTSPDATTSPASSDATTAEGAPTDP